MDGIEYQIGSRKENTGAVRFGMVLLDNKRTNVTRCIGALKIVYSCGKRKTKYFLIFFFIVGKKNSFIRTKGIKNISVR
jgi:hypothetical protein